MSIKDHMIPKASCIGTFATTVFNKMGKHTHILNKIVGVKIPKRQCQKTINFGGTNVVPTRKIQSRVVYNNKFSMCQVEINASKSTAFKWLAYNKAFQTIDKNKSYAQALANAVPVTDQHMKKAETFTAQVIHKNPPLATKVSKRDDRNFSPIDTTLAITSTVSCHCSDPSSNKKLQASVEKTDCTKNVGVTVTGARPCGASVLLQNRFQPLQMLMGDCHVEPQSQQDLQGQNDKHSVTKAVNAKSIQSNFKLLLASQENELLVGEKKLGLSQREYLKAVIQNSLKEYKCLPGYTCRRI